MFITNLFHRTFFGIQSLLNLCSFFSCFDFFPPAIHIASNNGTLLNILHKHINNNINQYVLDKNSIPLSHKKDCGGIRLYYKYRNSR